MDGPAVLAHPRAAGTRAGEALVVGAIVTYNPGPELASHLAALRGQVAHLVVVDNASADAEAVREACVRADCEFVANPRNLGIAAALNQAAARAEALGADWLATFDHDSLAPAGGVAQLLAVARSHPQAERIGVVAMSHADRGTGRSYHHPSDVLREGEGWRELRTTITSGSLVRVAALRELGGFEERLFIDCVDHALCLGLRRRGWRVVEVPGVLLAHSLGESRVHRILGRSTVATHHGPLRRYYMTRNHLEVFGRNLLFDPVLSGRVLATVAAGMVLVPLLEEQRLAKMGAMLRGVFDFATRRFGPRP